MTPTHQMTVLEYLDLRRRAWETLLHTQKTWSHSGSHSAKFDKAAKDVKTALKIYEIVQQNRPRAFQNFGWNHPNLASSLTTHKSDSSLSLPSTTLVTPYSSATNSPYIGSRPSLEGVNTKMASLDIGPPGLSLGIPVSEDIGNRGLRLGIESQEDEVVLFEVKSPVPQMRGVMWAL